MRIIDKALSKKAGMPPGSLIHIGERKVEQVDISVIDYSDQSIQEKNITDISQLSQYKNTDTVSWINITGLHDIQIIQDIGNIFQIHPLVLEDILNTGQRPKIEDYESYQFIVIKMITYCQQNNNGLNSEQVSLILAQGCIISFQERPGDVFEPVRERLRTHKGRIRKMHSDYLCYCLLDSIVDHYFEIVEKFGHKSESLEAQILQNAEKKELIEIQQLKKGASYLKKSVWPVRELVNRLEKSESPLISTSTQIYFRDIYDHTIQVMEMIESFREISSGMLEIYLSNTSNKMNEVMKTLTVIATMFIPLTFVVGIYGMNFKYMPELDLKYAYPLIWLLMLAIVTTMLIYFKKKNWF